MARPGSRLAAGTAISTRRPRPPKPTNTAGKPTASYVLLVGRTAAGGPPLTEASETCSSLSLAVAHPDWTAILATAYAAALNADMHGVAGLISLICGLSLGGAYREGRRLRASAALAEDVIMKAQERLATTLANDSLRMVERERATSSSSRLFWRQPVTTQAAFIGIVVSLTGAVYTWVATP